VAGNDVVSSRVLTIPNAISFVRLLLVPVFAVLLADGADGWALLVLAVSGASDWLDGVLARNGEPEQGRQGDGENLEAEMPKGVVRH